jgi:hypothetical protein
MGSRTASTDGCQRFSGLRVTKGWRFPWIRFLGGEIHRHFLDIHFAQAPQHFLLFHMTAGAAGVLLRGHNQIDRLLASQAGYAACRADATLSVAANTGCGHVGAFLVSADVTPKFHGCGLQRGQAGKKSGDIPDLDFADTGYQLLQGCMLTRTFAVGVHIWNLPCFAAAIQRVATGAVLFHEGLPGFDVDRGCGWFIFTAASGQQ